MIDDESRRRDEAQKKIRDWRRRSDGDCRLLFEVAGAIVDEVEQNLAARKLVRDFFTDRARARQAPASSPEAACRDHFATRRGDA